MRYQDSFTTQSSRTVPLLKKFDEEYPSSFLSRDLSGAREAFSSLDAEKSRLAHQVRPRRHSITSSRFHIEHHSETSSEYLKAFVFGGLDGIVTIFAIVAGCVGASISSSQVLIIGLANVIADGVSMAFGEYVSAVAETDYLKTERDREQWEVANFPEGEKQEMIDIYQHKYNFIPEDAHKLVEIAFKYKDFYLNHMMAEELGILYDVSGPSPLQRGAVMFFAFLIFGLIPLSGYSLWLFFFHDQYTDSISVLAENELSLLSAATFSLITLFSLGAIKASFIRQGRLKAGFQMVINGTIAGLIAYSFGFLIRKIVP